MGSYFFDGGEYRENLKKWFENSNSLILKQVEIAERAVSGEFQNSGGLEFSKYVKIPDDWDFMTSPDRENAPTLPEIYSRCEWIRCQTVALSITGDTAYRDSIEKNAGKYFQELERVSNDWAGGGFNYESPGLGHTAFRPLLISVRIGQMIAAYEISEELIGFSDGFRHVYLDRIDADIELLIQAANFSRSGVLSNGKNFYAVNESLFCAEALLTYSLYFDGRSGTGDTKSLALELIDKALDAQIFSDGGHVEFAPGYLKSVYDILNRLLRISEINDFEMPQDLSQRVSSIKQALVSLTHVDGSLAAFSDTARGKYDLGLPDGESFNFLNKFGYTSVRGQLDGGKYSIILDSGVTGESSHSQRDVFSFELMYGDDLLVADPGNYLYSLYSEIREYISATENHNTISVNRLNHASVGIDEDKIDVEENEVAGGTWRFSALSRAYDFIDGSPTVKREISHAYDKYIYFTDSFWSLNAVDVQIALNLNCDDIVYMGGSRFAAIKDHSVALWVDVSQGSSMDWRLLVSDSIITYGNSEIFETHSIKIQNTGTHSSVEYRLEIPESKSGISDTIIAGGARDNFHISEPLLFSESGGEMLVKIENISAGLSIFLESGSRINSGQEMSLSDFYNLSYALTAGGDIGSFTYYSIEGGGAQFAHELNIVLASNNAAYVRSRSDEISIGKGDALWIDEIFDISARQGDVVNFEFLGERTGLLSFDGVRILQDSFSVNFEEIDRLQYISGRSLYVDTLVVSVDLGGESKSATADISTENAAPIVFSPKDTFRFGDLVSLDNAFSFFDPDGDEVVSYVIGFDESAKVYLGGALLTPGVYSFSSEELPRLSLGIGGDGTSSGSISVSASDGEAWSEEFVFSPLGRENMAPTVSTKLVSIDLNEGVDLSDFVSVFDGDSDNIVMYSIYDADVGGVSLLIGGDNLPARQTFRFSPSEFSDIKIWSSDFEGNGRFIVRAFDGRVWSDAATLKVAVGGDEIFFDPSAGVGISLVKPTCDLPDIDSVARNDLMFLVVDPFDDIL